ncbi:hypothetical protein ACQPZZ_13680 [Microbispora sp. CA-135349]|uniref:hypothetical protein n=1 Tax=Microbispora sp. CA-135349 TaxID=3239953 RepID=UPI003D917C31
MERDRAAMDRQAILVGEALYEGSRDGTLTDAEINSATRGFPWHAGRSASQIRVVVRTMPTTPVKARCFVYLFSSPLSSNARPQISEVDSCEEAVHHPRPSAGWR